ncbi:hypothetical protein [Sinorhizobium meliloti]|uniref:hypothetical protein n=1 Tax=Rhizobium meliloti TaxID=382 RepID=UPI00036F2097|nr:hypothetical protein [Sinorhizobium meliloti]
MKLNPPLSAADDPENETLIIQGIDNEGQSATVEIPYGDSRQFISWLLSVFQEQSRSTGIESAILIDKFNVSMHKLDEQGNEAISFNFVSDQLNLTFVTPIPTRSPARIAAIQGHLQQLFAEMTAEDDVKTQ